jgi:asparagine synthase (glutamine-hydrolysing)
MDEAAFERLSMQDRLDEAGWDFYSSGPFGKSARQAMLTDGPILETAGIDLGFRALHRIETRDPLANLRLVEWCFGLPEEAFRHDGRGRGLVRQIMAGRMPESVLNNQGAGRQTIDWHLRMSDDLGQLNEELSAIAEDPDTRDLFDVSRLNKLLKDWPDKDPLGRPMKDTTAAYYQVAIPSAISAARLVRRAKGSNR